MSIRSHDLIGQTRGEGAYPEVDVEVAGAAKLAITDLEGDGHLVIAMEALVEAFPAVCRQLDVVRNSRAEQAGRKQQFCCLEEKHGDSSLSFRRGSVVRSWGGDRFRVGSSFRVRKDKLAISA